MEPKLSIIQNTDPQKNTDLSWVSAITTFANFAQSHWLACAHTHTHTHTHSHTPLHSYTHSHTSRHTRSHCERQKLQKAVERGRKCISYQIRERTEEEVYHSETQKSRHPLTSLVLVSQNIQMSVSPSVCVW